MTIRIEQTDYTPVPMGTYDAVVEAITTEDGMYGPQLKWEFDLADMDKTLLGWTSTTFSRKSKLYAWTRAIVFNGATIPKSYAFSDADVLGKPVKLVVLTKEGDNGEFNRIDTVLPATVASNGGRTEDEEPLF